MKFLEIVRRFQFWERCDRIGPDILFSHWRLFFSNTMRSLCIAKFKHFGVNSEFRPGAYAIACSKISIGARVIIRPGCMLFAHPFDERGTITIQDDVLMGSDVHIYVTNHEFKDTTKPIIAQGHQEPQPVIIEMGAWIGSKVIILPGVSIGRNSVVGAGSVVTKDVYPMSVVAGNPAKLVRSLN
jgi:acetyltransferase-like isoleucine patch superfamily enzyme